MDRAIAPQFFQILELLARRECRAYGSFASRNFDGEILIPWKAKEVYKSVIRSEIFLYPPTAPTFCAAYSHKNRVEA